MALAIGDRLDHYVISEPLGAGGMGEVYRATDERLGREVAIKVLSAEFAANAERLARFEREAKVLASLNHPNIATLHGFESVTDASGGRTNILVMEFVDGADLDERISDRGLPINEAVRIARRVALGLEAAHVQGIVHRDLKPANIRVTIDGTIKILDFGLAKPWHPLTGREDLNESPTLTAEMTREGTILGTAPYLSPEQARGQTVDQRADIWSFGCVLYEMLAGHRAFDGGTSTEVMAHILERDPDWDALPKTVPPPLRRLLGRCMEKDPNRRLRDAGDLAIALEDLIKDRYGPAPPVSGGAPVSSRAARFVPWLVASAAVVVGMVGWMAKSAGDRPQTGPTLRFTEHAPTEIDVVRNNHSGSAVSVSPDGQVLVWVGAAEKGAQLWSRHLDEGEAHPVEGTTGAQAPFFSPDSEWIGFWADGKLKKVAVRGGVPRAICEITHVHGPFWGDGLIVLGAVGDGSLYSVDLASGVVEIIRIPDRTGFYLGDYPKLFPHTRTMLVSSRATGSVDQISLDSGEITTLVDEGANASYLPSGHLVWVQGDDLVAAPFDIENKAVTGDALTVVDGIFTETHVGFVSHYAVSSEGTLAYLPGTVSETGSIPVWVALDGAMESLPVPAQGYHSPRVSPNGQRILLSVQSETQSLWIADSDRGFIGPLTGDEGHDYWAIWTPDGSHVIYNSQRSGENSDVWIVSVNEKGEPKQLTTGAAGHHPPAAITRDGQSVLVGLADGPLEDMDIMVLQLNGEPTLAPLLATGANESHPSFSPDGRWIAYASDVTGDFEVYVQRFPEFGGTIRVSSEGGQEPLWSPAGDRLYFRSTDGRRVHAVDVRMGGQLAFGEEEVLFEGSFDRGPRWGAKWDIHPDGDRFLMLQIKHRENPRDIKVVTNWFAELERLVPTAN